MFWPHLGYFLSQDRNQLFSKEPQFFWLAVVQLLSPVWPHGLQRARLPSPSLSPGVAQTHVHRVGDAIQPSHPVISFSSCPQSFPASGSFLISLLFTSGGQSTGASASASVFPMNIQDWISFRIDWLDPLAVQGTLKSLLQHHSAKASILQHSAFFMVQLSHPYMTTGKTVALTRWTFVGKVNVSAFEYAI